MTVYTYTSNIDPQDHTEIIRFKRTNGSNASLSKNHAIDLDSSEATALRTRIVLTPGGNPDGAGAVGVQIDQVTAILNSDGSWTPQRPLTGFDGGSNVIVQQDEPTDVSVNTLWVEVDSATPPNVVAIHVALPA